MRFAVMKEIRLPGMSRIPRSSQLSSIHERSGSGAKRSFRQSARLPRLKNSASSFSRFSCAPGISSHSSSPVRMYFITSSKRCGSRSMKYDPSDCRCCFQSPQNLARKKPPAFRKVDREVKKNVTSDIELYDFVSNIFCLIQTLDV